MRSAYTNRSDLRELLPRLNPARVVPPHKALSAPLAQTTPPQFKLKAYGRTHVGCKRLANEDSFWLLPKHSLFIVADGMGGHAGGQIASTISAHEMGRQTVHMLSKAEEDARKSGNDVDLYTLLKRSTMSACDQVTRITDAYPELESMGSTLTSLLVYNDTAYLSHLGDSRAYLIRDHKLIQITEDHSYVQELVNFGEITPDQALVHIRRNLILKSISKNSSYMDIEPDIAAIKLRSGDRFLICSDGLIEHVRDPDILETVVTLPASKVPQALIEKANSSEFSSPSGIGTDNTTVVVVEIGKRRNHRK